RLTSSTARTTCVGYRAPTEFNNFWTVSGSLTKFLLTFSISSKGFIVSLPSDESSGSVVHQGKEKAAGWFHKRRSLAHTWCELHNLMARTARKASFQESASNALRACYCQRLTQSTHVCTDAGEHSGFPPHCRFPQFSPHT